jgi:hypothetical protein
MAKVGLVAVMTLFHFWFAARSPISARRNRVSSRTYRIATSCRRFSSSPS